MVEAWDMEDVKKLEKLAGDKVEPLLRGLCTAEAANTTECKL